MREWGMHEWSGAAACCLHPLLMHNNARAAELCHADCLRRLAACAAVTRHMDVALAGQGVTCVAVHPGELAHREARAWAGQHMHSAARCSTWQCRRAGGESRGQAGLQAEPPRRALPRLHRNGAD